MNRDYDVIQIPDPPRSPGWGQVATGILEVTMAEVQEKLPGMEEGDVAT